MHENRTPLRIKIATAALARASRNGMPDAELDRIAAAADRIYALPVRGPRCAAAMIGFILENEGEQLEPIVATALRAVHASLGSGARRDVRRPLRRPAMAVRPPLMGSRFDPLAHKPMNQSFQHF